MAPESMVHALEIVHGLLTPVGRLVDLHPSGQPPPLEVRIGRKRYCAGWLRETDDYVEYEQASAALQSVAQRGLFAWEEQRTFAFTTYADSLVELQAYLAREWQDAVIDDQVARQIADWLRVVGGEKEISLREIVAISSLRPL